MCDACSSPDSPNGTVPVLRAELRTGPTLADKLVVTGGVLGGVGSAVMAIATGVMAVAGGTGGLVGGLALAAAITGGVFVVVGGALLAVGGVMALRSIMAYRPSQ